MPSGSLFKGYENFTVQSLVFKSHNILFRLERWITPDGDHIIAEVPSEDAVGHFGTPLICYILYQYYQAQVPQPLIFEQLKEIGVDISTGQVNRIITEGALLSSIFQHAINPMLIILSDDAGQFCLLLHALCWIHAERTIKKLVDFNDEQRKALEEIREQIWNYYSDLKAYKESPDNEKKTILSDRFDEIFMSQTCYGTLNQALKRIYNNKAELLLVLDHPNIPLHNNLSEGDIREYVKRRKISGSTRSDLVSVEIHLPA